MFGHRKGRTLFHAVVAAAVGVAALVAPFSTKPGYAEAATSKLELKSDEPITAGARLKTYRWSSTRSGKPIGVDIRATVVDLQNPYVKLDVMTGVQNQFTKKQTVRGMATETGAVAGINGDFFNTMADGAPLGAEVANGTMMSSAPLYSPGFYSFAVTGDNKPVIDGFGFQGTVKTKDGASFPLGGINKTYYWYESTDPTLNGKHSHVDAMYLYTSAWGSTERANDRDTDLTEVLVRNGIIQQISRYQKIDAIPPKDGYILRTEGAAAQFVLQHMKVGDPIAADYTMKPSDTSATYDTKKLKMMISGQTILVDKGAPATFSRWDNDANNGNRSRTGVGYTKDERYVYLVTADRATGSDGMSMEEFQQALVQMGLYKAMNLDGGGSTQMVARPFGETTVQVANQLENGSERRIVNALGVYSLAPKGEVKGFLISGEKTLLVGEKATYTLKAYDQYDNPVAIDATQVQWSVPAGQGTFDKNVFTPAAKGTATITVSSGNAKQTFDVKVIGSDDIASMTIQPSTTIVIPNTDITLSVLVKTKSGLEKSAPGSLFQWDSKEINGKLTGDTLHVDSTKGETAQITAKYDGFSASIPMAVGENRLWADFDKLFPAALSFLGSSQDVTGSVYKIPGTTGTSGNVLQLKYDMTKGTGTKAAYITFGDGGNGIQLDGEPQTLMMNVLGDNSLNWLRAQVTDADGQLVYVDLARTVNWTGWRKVSADLTAFKLKYPIKLKRIYLANVAQGQDERNPVGSISIDDIQLQYKLAPKNHVKLSIDKLEYMVNGIVQQMDQAPVIEKDNTLVPVRFAAEALGGQVEWNNDERKATVKYGTKEVELWLDKPDIMANGAKVTAEVAPKLMNERTMVPLRVLSENLGWKVTWENETRSVYLE